ncbi:MAG TPA: hypothetical protein VK922_06645 [Gemmatimonadaceae bacterium]|nr:hypothetical protein [Gemmatimonadaceae bacterium]
MTTRLAPSAAKANTVARPMPPAPVMNDLELAYESVDVISDPGLTHNLSAADPASPTARALDLLASWTSTASDPDASITR